MFIINYIYNIQFDNPTVQFYNRLKKYETDETFTNNFLRNRKGIILTLKP